MVGKSTRGLVAEEDVIQAIKALDDGEGAPETGIISLLKEKGIAEEKVKAVIKDLKERGEITAIKTAGDIEFYRWTPR
jgi:DNA-binding transcriptional regulator PaaX